MTKKILSLALLLVAVSAFLRDAPVAAGRLPVEPARAPLVERVCTKCHLPNEEAPYWFANPDSLHRAQFPADECATCHVNNSLLAAGGRPAVVTPLSRAMLQRIRTDHAYVRTPTLAFRAVEASTGQSLQRFTRCGLEQFLAAPVPRRKSAKQSMFELLPEQRDELFGELDGELAECPPDVDAAAIERGRELFAENRCNQCHGLLHEAPLLRIGVPLLGRDYFMSRVRNGSAGFAEPGFSRTWAAREGQIVPGRGAVEMPAHRAITDSELDALYAYISSDRSDLPAEPAADVLLEGADAHPSPALERAAARRLYRRVVDEVFGTTCRHCHADGADQQPIGSLFGLPSSGDAPLALPLANAPVRPSPALRAAFSAREGCSDSPLLARLRARHREWSNARGATGSAGNERGMPLTMPPLPDAAIELVEQWTRVGCPSDLGNLCVPCSTDG